MRDRIFQSFGQQWDVQKQLAESLEKPEDLLKSAFAERVKEMSALLDETVKTQGWKKVIQPFIESQLTPDKLLKASDDEKKELMAWNKLLKFVTNITKMGEKLQEMEAREK